MEKRTLRRQLGIVAMIGYVAVVIVLLVVDYWFSYECIRRFENTNTQMLSKYVESIDEEMDMTNKLALSIYNENPDFQKLSYREDEINKYLSTYELLDVLKDQMQTNHALSGAVIFYEYGEQRRYLFREEISFSVQQTIVDQAKIRLQNQNTQKVQFLVRAKGHVYYVQMLTKKQATIACVTDLVELQQKVNVEDEQREFILTYGKVILNQNRLAEKLQITGSDTEIANHIFTGKERIYKEDCDWDNLTVFLYVKETAVRQLKLQIFMLILVTVIVGIFVVIVYGFLKKQILTPLKKLADTMTAIGQGEHFGKMEQIAPYAEFEQVTDSFNGMMSEIEQLKISSYEEQIAKQRAQMQCFQLQLSPHFYLNCLKTLNYMAIEKDTKNMQEVILEISALMRYLLKNEAELVTVEEEIRNVKTYVHLQQLISSRTVECVIQVEPELMQCEIPILAIQTFVENTFKYAVARDETNIKVSIKGILLNVEGESMMDFTIEDNGKGYPQEILDIINANEFDMETGASAIGIRNVKQRCKLLYGDRAEYTFYNMQGAVSELILPINEEGVKDECIGD